MNNRIYINHFILSLTFLTLANHLYAQEEDTIAINVKSLHIDYLKEGTNRYLVYFISDLGSKRSSVQFWTRSVARTNEDGNGKIIISQSWQDKDTVFHTSVSQFEAKSLRTLSHDVWQGRGGRTSKVFFDFKSKIVVLNGDTLTSLDTTATAKKVWDGFVKSSDRYFLNWHTDLEVFSALPFKVGRVFSIPFYDPGFSPVRQVYYKVTREVSLVTYDNIKIRCWLMERNSPNGGTEVYWISKKTREVLMLQQKIDEKRYRYKLKLAFDA